MPEIVLTGLRDVGSGLSASQSQMLESMRKSEQIKLWAFEGTDEAAEKNWCEFLLRDTPDWIIHS